MILFAIFMNEKCSISLTERIYLSKYCVDIGSTVLAKYLFI